MALERAATHGFEAGAEVAQRVTWLHADLLTWVPAPAAYQLVSAQFLQLPKDQREPVHRRLAASTLTAARSPSMTRC